VDLVVKEGSSLQEAVTEAREKAKQVKEEGVDQAALDAAAAKGFGNALFEYDEDEVGHVVEEFYPDTAVTDDGRAKSSSVLSQLVRDLPSSANSSG
jgi:hypothetical protein